MGRAGGAAGLGALMRAAAAVILLLSLAAVGAGTRAVTAQRELAATRVRACRAELALARRDDPVRTAAIETTFSGGAPEYPCDVVAALHEEPRSE